MVYIPQLNGLGLSDISKLCSIQSLAEVQAYLSHSIFEPQLVEISNALLSLGTSDPHAVFGSADDMKLRSSMTFFSAVPGAPPVLEECAGKIFRRDKGPKSFVNAGINYE